jgi:ribosomal protein S18 acetylase RimI-like enzyme
MRIAAISGDEVSVIKALAYEIWPVAFREILSQKQLEYMLVLMYSEEILKNQLSNGHQFFVLYLDKRPVGFMGIEERFPVQNQLKIHKLYVLPDIQGSGVGRKFIVLAEKIAREKGLNEITLNVNRFNKAVGFYQRMGFKIEKEEDIEIGNGYLMEDYVMTLPH